MSPHKTIEPTVIVDDADEMTLRQKLQYSVDELRNRLGGSSIRRGSLSRSPEKTRAMRRRFARFFPQWLRTTVVVTLALASALSWLAATSTAQQAMYSLPIAVLYPPAVGAAAHVWPTRTPPWRTVAWTWTVSWVTAALLYLAWDVDWALYPALIVIVVIAVARCNANARRLWNRLVAWHVRRTLGPGATLKPSTPRIVLNTRK